MEAPKGKVTCPVTQPARRTCTQAAWLSRCYAHLASFLRLSDFTLQTTEFKEGLARFVQAARIIKWRKNTQGKSRGKSGRIIETQEAGPAVLR